MGEPRCVDCIAEGITSARPTPLGGPRSPLCVSHDRARRKTKSAKSHARHVETTYGITADEYQLILAFQGGRCAICQTATGKSRRLAVDHDHQLEGRASVRGILCGRCNFDLIGKNSVEALQRAIDYLKDPPARKVLYAAEEEGGH